MSLKPFILIADDDQEDRYLLHTAFEEIGLSNDIHLVENGLQVFKYLETSFEQSGMPSLIVLDLNMPILDGWGFLNYYEKLDSELRQKFNVYILSSSIDEVDINESKKYDSVRSFFSKPLTGKIIQSILSDSKSSVH